MTEISMERAWECNRLLAAENERLNLELREISRTQDFQIHFWDEVSRCEPLVAGYWANLQKFLLERQAQDDNR